MNKELETLRKETVLVWLRYYPGILKEGLRNTTENKSSQLISEPKFEPGTS
jgi:hypothetical protein